MVFRNQDLTLGVLTGTGVMLLPAPREAKQGKTCTYTQAHTLTPVFIFIHIYGYPPMPPILIQPQGSLQVPPFYNCVPFLDSLNLGPIIFSKFSYLLNPLYGS